MVTGSFKATNWPIHSISNPGFIYIYIHHCQNLCLAKCIVHSAKSTVAQGFLCSVTDKLH